MRNYPIELLNKLSTSKEEIVFDNKINVIPLIEDKESGLDLREYELALKTLSARNATPVDIISIRKQTGFNNLDITNSDILEEKIDFNLTDVPFSVYKYERSDNKVNNRPLIIYVHGGSYFAGEAKTYKNISKFMCEETNAVVMNVEYSLAPEHKFPCAYNQILALTKYLINNPNGYDVNKICLIGDSAGAQLVLSVAEEFNNNEIALLGLLYPTCTMDYISHPFEWKIGDFNIPENERMFIEPRLCLGRNDGKGNLELMMMIKNIYLQGFNDDRDYRLSPLYGNIKNLPKTMIFTAEYDGLRQQGEFLASILTKNNIPNICYRYQGVHHAFIDKLGVFPQAEDALIKFSKEVNKL